MSPGGFSEAPERRPVISTRLFVGNLSYQTSKEELVRLLSEAGNVVDAHLPSDRETGRPRGFAFVTFSNEAEAAEAIRRFHDRDLNGRKMVVNAAEPRRPAGSGGFGGGGGRPAGGGGRPPGGGGGFGGRPGASPPPPPAFFDRGGPPGGSFRSKGSRRGLRAKKRSL